MSVVLDASAILAIVFREPGANKVIERAEGAQLSAVNLLEILTKAARKRGTDPAALAAQLRSFGIADVAFCKEQAEIAARLPAFAAGRPLSLADRARLSLAIHRRLPILTGDRDWAALDLGIVIELIR